MQRAEAKLGEFVEEAAREVQNRGRTQKKCSYPKQSLYLSYYIIDCNPHAFRKDAAFVISRYFSRKAQKQRILEAKEFSFLHACRKETTNERA